MTIRARLVELGRSPRIRTYARRAFLSVLGVYVFYLVAANVFLGFHLLDRVATSDDGTVELRTGRAWSLVPGRASVRGFVLRLDDDDLQLRLEVANATTSIDLFRLFRREVKLSSLEASGVSIRVRMRVEAITKDNEQRIAAFPEIEGALGPPLFSAAKKTEKKPVEDAWHVDIGGARVEAREVWIEEYRLRGEMRAVGSFALWPGKDFVLRPSTVEVHQGELAVGPRTLTNDFSLEEARAEIHPVPLRDTKGTAMLGYLVASGRGSSTLLDASFLEIYPGEWMPKVKVAPSPSTFDARFALGKFTKGTAATLEANGAEVVLPGVTVRGPSTVRVAVPNDGDLELSAYAKKALLSLDALPSSKRAAWEASEASATQILYAAVGEESRLGLGTYSATVRTPTLDWFEDLADLGTKTRGSAIGTARLERDAEGHIRGPWTARIEGGSIATKEIEVGVTSKASGTIHLLPSPKEGIFLEKIHVEAPSASVRPGSDEPFTTWLRGDVPKVEIVSQPKLVVRTSGVFGAGTGGLVAGAVKAKAGLVLGPIAACFLDKEGMDVRAGLAVAGKDIVVDVPHAAVGSVDSRAFYRRYGDKSRFAMVLLHPPMSVGVRVDEGLPFVLPAAGDGWLEAQKPEK